MSNDAYKLFFRGLARQAPGADAATLQALESVELPDEPVIYDLGAGTGSSALVLAEELDTKVIAVDQMRESLDALELRAERREIADLIEAVEADVFELDLEPESVDLIWSEGAIYAFGWKRALEACRAALKPGGWLVVTDCVWVSEERPDEAVAFWESEYPQMTTTQNLVDMAESAGFEVVETFEMMRHAWADYYGPLRQRVALVESSEPAEDLQEVVDAVAEEIRVFEDHGHTWNYVFFVMKRGD